MKILLILMMSMMKLNHMLQSLLAEATIYTNSKHLHHINIMRKAKLSHNFTVKIYFVGLLMTV